MDDGTRWRIGELSSSVGSTVRTLHHYDQIGLLVPSERTPAGHRLYGAADVRRLYGIIALRQLGLGLAEIAAFLGDDGDDPRSVIRHHLEQLRIQMETQRGLEEQLARILGILERSEVASTKDFIDAMEVMSRMDKYYTPEQLAQLEERRNELGDEGMRKAEQDWADLIAAVRAEMEAGSDPAGERMQALAAQWQGLIEQFTGGAQGIRNSLQNMYEQEGMEEASQGMVDPQVMAYMGKAITARGSG